MEKKTVKVVAAVIRDNEGRILATRRGHGAQAGGWEFPGGKIEKSETAQQALRREISEELGMSITVGDSITVVEHDYGDFHLEMECFWCEAGGQEPVLREHLAARWLALDEQLPGAVEWLPADRQLLPLLTLPRFGVVEVVGKEVPGFLPTLCHGRLLVQFVPASVQCYVVRARMLNLPNLGSDAIASVTTPIAENLDKEIHRVAKAILKIGRQEKGDLVLSPLPSPPPPPRDGDGVSHSMSISPTCKSDDVEFSIAARKTDEKPKRKRSFWPRRQHDAEEHDVVYADYSEPLTDSDVLFDIGLKDTVEPDYEAEPDYDAQRQKALNDIEAMILDYVTRYHADPTALLTKIRGKIIVNPDKVSPLRVNSDLEIVLPYYNEKVVDLYPQAKAVYFLMLRHPEGIVLKDMPDYAEEMQMLYDLIMPKRDDDKARETVANLCDPFTGRLQQVLSRVKKAFDSVIYNNDIAANYYIVGERGKPYRIALPSDQITLPAVLLP